MLFSVLLVKLALNILKQYLIMFGKSDDIACDGTLRNRNVNSRAGAELIKLLMCTKVKKGMVEIFNEDQLDNSLYSKLMKDFRGRVYVVPHPARYDIFRNVWVQVPPTAPYFKNKSLPPNRTQGFLFLKFVHAEKKAI